MYDAVLHIPQCGKPGYEDTLVLPSMIEVLLMCTYSMYLDTTRLFAVNQC